MFGLPQVFITPSKKIEKDSKTQQTKEDEIAQSLGIEKPRLPDDSECCHSSCDNCVFNIYNQKLEEYETYMKLMLRRDSDEDDSSG